MSEKVTPLYPFGHGLSYTSFEYSDLALKQKLGTAGESIDISLRVKNVGKVAGEEVVQLYIRDEFASAPRPIRELKGYRRVPLNPGESKTVTFHLPVNQLAFYDVDLCLNVESGKINVMLGSSSEDIRLEGEFEIVGDKKMVVNERVFVCPISVE